MLDASDFELQLRRCQPSSVTEFAIEMSLNNEILLTNARARMLVTGRDVDRVEAFKGISFNSSRTRQLCCEEMSAPWKDGTSTLYVVRD